MLPPQGSLWKIRSNNLRLITPSNSPLTLPKNSLLIVLNPSDTNSITVRSGLSSGVVSISWWNDNELERIA